MSKFDDYLKYINPALEKFRNPVPPGQEIQKLNLNSSTTPFSIDAQEALLHKKATDAFLSHQESMEARGRGKKNVENDLQKKIAKEYNGETAQYLRDGVGVEFTLEKEDLLVYAKMYKWNINLTKPLMFGIRGAFPPTYWPAKIEFSEKATLQYRIIDFVATNCIIGLLDFKEGVLACFPGSTVPGYKFFKSETHNIILPGFYLSRSYLSELARKNGNEWRFLADKSNYLFKRSQSTEFVKKDGVYFGNPADEVHSSYSNFNDLSKETDLFFRPSDIGNGSRGCQIIIGPPIYTSYKPWNVKKTYWENFTPWQRFLAEVVTRGGERTIYDYLLIESKEFIDFRKSRESKDQIPIKYSINSSSPHIEKVNLLLRSIITYEEMASTYLKYFEGSVQKKELIIRGTKIGIPTGVNYTFDSYIYTMAVKIKYKYSSIEGIFTLHFVKFLRQQLSIEKTKQPADKKIEQANDLINSWEYLIDFG